MTELLNSKIKDTICCTKLSYKKQTRIWRSIKIINYPKNYAMAHQSSRQILRQYVKFDKLNQEVTLTVRDLLTIMEDYAKQ